MKLTKSKLKEIIREELLNEAKKISKSYTVDYVGDNGFFLVNKSKGERMYIEGAELNDIIKAFKKL
jgi:uncharacterized protein YtpQ (UPF0354 family)